MVERRHRMTFSRYRISEFAFSSLPLCRRRRRRRALRY